MNTRPITSDEELLTVFKVLLAELKARMKDGKFIIFPPWKFILPEDKIEEIKDKKKKTEKRTVNFSFGSEEANIEAGEALRLLGVTLYHLAVGRSELTDESFLLDGYRRSLNSGLWPVILTLLKKEEQDIEKIEEMIEKIDLSEVKPNIQSTNSMVNPRPINATPPIQQTDYLRLISGNELLILDESDGTEVLADANDMFTAGIDLDFRNWNADEEGPVTGKTRAAVYELIKDATFAQIYSISADRDKLCFSQHQIKEFVGKYRNWLRTEGYGTFFLFKSNNNFFVAEVRVDSDGSLFAFVHRLLYDYIWYAECRYRVVFPQLA